MKVLQHYYILNQFDLPTIEWKEYFPDTKLSNDILWSVKVEEDHISKVMQSNHLKDKCRNPFLFFRDRRVLGKHNKSSIIGVESEKASRFAQQKLRTKQNSQRVIYYPYYTVVKSGILDINRNRTVIEGVWGEIDQLVKHNHVDLTMIFEQEDLNVTGDEKLFTKEEMIPIIDYGKEVRKLVARDLEHGKNIQLYFSYLYKTDECLKPVGELQLAFYECKIF